MKYTLRLILGFILCCTSALAVKVNILMPREVETDTSKAVETLAVDINDGLESIETDCTVFIILPNIATSNKKSLPLLVTVTPTESYEDGRVAVQINPPYVLDKSELKEVVKEVSDWIKYYNSEMRKQKPKESKKEKAA